MKLTITIEGVVQIEERWEVGSVAHERRYPGAPAGPVTLSVEHSDVDALLGQAEQFILSSISDGRERSRMPSTAKLERELVEVCLVSDKRQDAIRDLRSKIDAQHGTIDAMSSWKKRALEAREVVDELMQTLNVHGTCIPPELGTRIEKLRASYPVLL